MNLLTRAAGYLSGFTFKFWLGLCLLIAACVPLAYCKGRSDGSALKQAQIDRAVTKAVQKARDADNTASEQRAADTERNNDASDARQDAIRDAGRDGLNCERLRRAYPDRDLPAPC
ncbi:MAG: hypothetical protein ABGX08_00015 [Citromicrobium sp.]|nr:hypothetical protein [Citromicrobium sp.]|tara:strand:- start:150 stop:497 length:348 start_codon:yes stop_codon:yes gene_type:complete